VRNLTAKSCCDAMLSFWQFSGFPTKVTTDNATNFTGELTREFVKCVVVHRYDVRQGTQRPLVLSERLAQLSP